jgi:heptosyltransferase-2
MKKILVIQQKMIGDVLASAAICQAIKFAWPDSTVHYMVYPNTVAVIEGNPFIDEIKIFDPKTKGFGALRKLGKELSIEKYDAVIDAYGKWESVLPAYFSGAKMRIGHHKWYTSFFFTKTVTPAKNVSGSAIHHRLQLAQALTGKWVDIDFPKIYLSEKETLAAKQQLSTLPQKPIVMVSVLGSASNKSLPADYMAKMLDVAAESGVTLLFNYMPNQEDEARRIYDLCLPETQDKIVFDFYMKGLRPFLAVLWGCDALIGNEGGAVNMAKALRIPTFTVYSPWVGTSSWNMLTDDKTHVAVHLTDYQPDLYGARHPKTFKEKAEVLYKDLKPELFADRLRDFMRRIVN